MTITEFWPLDWPGSTTLARFDCFASDDIKLCGMVLKRLRSGDLRAFPPKMGRNLAFRLSPQMSEQITAAAVAAYAEHADARR